MVKFKGIVFEGGGARGIVYSGAIKAMNNNNMLDDIIHYVGTSVGSITAFLLALGFTDTEIIDKMVSLKSNQIIKKDLFFYMMDFFEWNGVLNSCRSLFLALTIGLLRIPINIKNLITTGGYYDNKPLYKWLESLLIEKGFDKNTSFNTLFEKTGNKLYITTTNIDMDCVEVFSPDNDKISIIDAVLISTSIPIFFKLRKINNDTYADGGIVANYNINFLSDNNIIPENKIVGLRVDTKSQKEGRKEGMLFKKQNKHKILGFFKVFNILKNMLDMMYEGANAPNLKGEHEQTTFIMEDYGIGVLDFSMNDKDKLKYIEKSEKDFLENLRSVK